MGLAGTAVVLLAVAFSLTFLPALLAVLGRRVDALRVPYLHPEQSALSHRAWQWLAATVMAHPWRVLVPVVVALILVGSPFLRLRLAGSDVGILPPAAESRRGEELYRAEFPSGESSHIVVVLHDSQGKLRSPESVGRAYDFAQWLGKLPNVSRVQGPVSLHPQITRDHYLQIFAASPEMLPVFIREAVAQTASDRLMVLAVSTPLRAGSKEAHDLVRAIRAARPPLDAEVLVTGQSAVDMDIAHTIAQNAPLTVAVIMLATYVVLDQFFAWEFILADIAKRPYITMGFTGFVLMIPLAITSTAGWIRRLGGRWWNRLHRLIYATGVAGVIHFLWLVKVISTEQIVYAVILGVLLGLRLWWAIAKRLATPAVAARAMRQPTA